jgi:GAF domain-containing protein
VTISKAISEVLEGRTVFVPDVATDERVLYREQAKQEGIASMLSVPMKLRGAVVGVLRLYTAIPREFTEEETRFVETAGNLAALALERTRTYEMIQQDYEALREDMRQWQAELGNEGLMGDLVTPPEEPAIKMPPGG